MPLWGKSPKNPADVVKAIKDGLAVLEKGDKKSDKALEEVTKNLGHAKGMLFGSSDHHHHHHHQQQSAGGVSDLGAGGGVGGGGGQSDYQLANLAQEMYNTNLLLALIVNLAKIDFEGKKDVTQVFNNILRRQIGTRCPTVEHICTRTQILFTLMKGYEQQDIALHCGSMLRECVRYEPLAKIMLHSEQFYNFFTYVEVSTFDIASDAFSTFKELLTRHKAMCAQFLEVNYERVFDTHYKSLLHSDNYVTRRQSLKLLGELLLDRHNFSVMTTYIASPDNLKLMMNMLRERSRNIQFEAFHVFKVFVANPNKPKPIVDILLRNHDRLVEFLTCFHTDRSEDEQFNDEKAYLIKQIKELKTSTAASAQQQQQQNTTTTTTASTTAPAAASNH